MSSQYDIQKRNYEAYIRSGMAERKVAEAMYRNLMYANTIDPDIEKRAMELLTTQEESNG